MPSFPQPGTVTICEINRELVTADHFSDDKARDTYAKILGTVFSPIAFEPDSLSATTTDLETVPQNKGSLGILSSAVQALLSGSVRPLLEPADVKLLQGIDLHSLSWHHYKPILAFISGPHHVTICDYDDSDGKTTCVLSHESQKDVKILEWRPNGGKTLSVACNGGICIWVASNPGNVPSVRSGVHSNTLSRGTMSRWILVDFLQSSDSELISALSWRLGTPIRRGLGGISLLKWSPSGDYFFAAKLYCILQDIAEFNMHVETFNNSVMGHFISGRQIHGHQNHGPRKTELSRIVPSVFILFCLLGATWDPDGRMILLSFSESSALGSIHFSSKPPSLDAHLIPVELPEIKSLTDSQVIEKIAWDASGERLAVSYRDGDELYKGLIAIFDVKRTPLISTSLIGFIRGPGDNPKPLAFSFHDKFKQGPLLSVVRHLPRFIYFPFWFSARSFFFYYKNDLVILQKKSAVDMLQKLLLEHWILLHVPSHIPFKCCTIVEVYRLKCDHGRWISSGFCRDCLVVK
ncbi:transducin/WD40 repeat-like superfamily protein [Striga asiatica]|uniref:Transducin/WD40 repeat-like superfamily protein n=1 Tax=Striga asiatica TaxID=4170 RepID=A0A5A7NZK1_STRAF|nr:transducin/WD40 repeat-like superfamily protein [Striga asiatica]